MRKIFILLIVMVTLLIGVKVFAQADDLSGVIAYPNPFNPSKGHTTVTFANLTDDVVIRIYKMNGVMVKKIEATNTSGTVGWWDVKNDSDKPLGTGTYIYLITNNAGQKAIGKIAVIR